MVYNIDIRCGFEGASFRKVFLDSSMVEHSAVNRGVVGSSPTRGVFSVKEWLRKCRNDTAQPVFFNIRPRGQAVKTSPFHGGNTSSILVGVTGTLYRIIL